MRNKQTLPGFLLTIEDNAKPAIVSKAVTDVVVIYAKLPELMKYEDEDGNIYDKFIEPNKPLLIATGGKEDAVKTLNLSDIELTREVRNMITLLPNDINIALCRLVTRDGEQPDENNLASMYEAIDFAFEMTENYPIKEVYVAGISLDKSVALEPNAFSKEVAGEISPTFNKVEVSGLFGEIGTFDGINKVTENKKAKVSLIAEREGTSLTETNNKGIYNKFTILVNNQPAMISTENNEQIPFEIIFNVDYSQADSPVATTSKIPTGLTATLTKVDNKLNLTITGNCDLVLDVQTAIRFIGSTITLNDLGQTTAGEVNLKEISFQLRKISSTANILKRMLEHVNTITATQNNCMLFLSPEPPKNASVKEICSYVDRVSALKEKIFERTLLVTETGRKIDAGMYLNVPVGSNQLNGIGGLTGFPQSMISSITGNTIVTQKLNSNFKEGDIVEIYTNNKLDIIQQKATVISVTISPVNTTQIVLDIEIPTEIINTKSPKYIMNVNNKDFNGNYLAIQYSNVCKEAGVEKSPSAVVWKGECHIMFSAPQKDKLNANKFSVLMQRYGTVQGEIDKSQLMTSTTSQYQDYENLAVIYELVKGCKEIGLKYKGTRKSGMNHLALIKKEIDDEVFKPATNVFIYPGYDLKLTARTLQAPNGKKEKALIIEMGVVEIETLKLLRIIARIN